MGIPISLHSNNLYTWLSTYRITHLNYQTTYSGATIRFPLFPPKYWGTNLKIVA